MAALHRLLCGRGAALPARPGPAVGVRAARGRACAVERGTVRTWCAAEAAGGAALRGRVSWCGERESGSYRADSPSAPSGT